MTLVGSFRRRERRPLEAALSALFTFPPHPPVARHNPGDEDEVVQEAVEIGTADAPASDSAAPAAPGWPREVDLILSAMDAARQQNRDRRHLARLPYRVRAELKLFSNQGGPGVTLYTRDVDPRGVGFITPHRLPLGYGGMLTILSPGGESTTVAVTVYRCREAVKGWFEGALYFNREQNDFGS